MTASLCLFLLTSKGFDHSKLGVAAHLHHVLSVVSQAHVSLQHEIHSVGASAMLDFALLLIP